MVEKDDAKLMCFYLAHPWLELKHANTESVVKVTSNKETLQVFVKIERKDSLLSQFV